MSNISLVDIRGLGFKYVMNRIQTLVWFQLYKRSFLGRRHPLIYNYCKAIVYGFGEKSKPTDNNMDKPFITKFTPCAVAVGPKTRDTSYVHKISNNRNVSLCSGSLE